MAKTPKSPKGPSLKRAARIYRRSHTKSTTVWDGARKFDSNAQDSAVGSHTSGRNTYKPKARQITLGGTRGGRGVTTRKTGRS